MRKYAVRLAIANRKACWTNYRNGNIHHFRDPFKTKKNEKLRGWSWTTEKNNVSRDGDKLYIFKRYLGEMRYYSTKQLRKLMPTENPECDPKIQRDPYGDYYLILSITKTCKPSPAPGAVARPASCDPGVRKFLVTYDTTDNSASVYGNRWATEVVRLLFGYDSMQSQLALRPVVSSQARRKLRRRMLKTRKRIQNLKDDLHHQVANELTKNHDCILLPKLDTQALAFKQTRKLKTKVVRQMMNAGHAKFFDRLKHKCLERGVTFMEVSEQYTSKTCPCCGHLNRCDEYYRCRDCEFQCDRDIVGALNILLRAVRQEAPEPSVPVSGGVRRNLKRPRATGRAS
jgi:IS605 OrfB family transposase